MKLLPCFMLLTSLAMTTTAQAENERQTPSANFDTSELGIDEVLNNPRFASLPRNNPMLDLLKVIEWYKKNYPHASESDVEEFLLENQRGAEDFNSIYDQWTHLTASEKALIISSPGNAALTVMTKDKAFELTTTHMGRNGLGDPSDAFRHAIWNALMSRYISKIWASSYATAHENKSEEELSQLAPDGLAERQHRTMDLFNNEKGRDCWSVFTDTMVTTSDEDLVERVKAKLNNGELTYFHN